MASSAYRKKENAVWYVDVGHHRLPMYSVRIGGETIALPLYVTLHGQGNSIHGLMVNAPQKHIRADISRYFPFGERRVSDVLNEALVFLSVLLPDYYRNDAYAIDLGFDNRFVPELVVKDGQVVYRFSTVIDGVKERVCDYSPLNFTSQQRVNAILSRVRGLYRKAGKEGIASVRNGADGTEPFVHVFRENRARRFTRHGETETLPVASRPRNTVAGPKPEQVEAPVVKPSGVVRQPVIIRNASSRPPCRREKHNNVLLVHPLTRRQWRLDIHIGETRIDLLNVQGDMMDHRAELLQCVGLFARKSGCRVKTVRVMNPHTLVRAGRVRKWDECSLDDYRLRGSA
ncbi:hypothetical protein GCM10023116_48200 [Kistimonas scapharcae]|uniref:Uncharacterized protein n=1 Tax=Kistimonas scapharcae TaxID=1036133 RepID=A0ABP8VAW6_9GAMM